MITEKSNSPAEKQSSGLARLFRITHIRVIAQVFFFVLFCFLIVIDTFGTAWFQKRGWPVNFFFNIDPLISLMSAISTHRLFGPLMWSLIILIPTLFLGRFFCGWVCPFGALHHFIGWALGPKKISDRINANRYRRFFAAKYWVLAVMLMMAVGVGLGYSRVSSLQIGLLDPFCLLHRSVTTVLLPLADQPIGKIYNNDPLYQNSFLIGAMLLVLLGLNVVIPRFFCRTLCPLGAMLGVVSRFAFWRVERSESRCTGCRRCVAHCEGACDPHTQLRLTECVVCLNCLDSCPEAALSYATGPQADSAGATLKSPNLAYTPPRVGPDVSRRQVITSVIAGAAAVPMSKLTGATTRNFNPAVIRPPGSLPEPLFLQACLKCGQCMRICPTNVLQPAGLEAGIEGIWTPILNNRIGKGCMLDCTACGQVCPTAAITPISIARKRGLGEHQKDGPIRLGTAFVDHGRCLPWAMSRPCAVCEEVCPVSPKAIIVRSVDEPVLSSPMSLAHYEGTTVTFTSGTLTKGVYSTGDYRLTILNGVAAGQSQPIVGNTEDTVSLPGDLAFKPAPQTGDLAMITIRLGRPQVDPSRCIGCGTCEHECPVSGLRAIRVSAENESRSKTRSLLLRS